MNHTVHICPLTNFYDRLQALYSIEDYALNWLEKNTVTTAIAK